MNEIYIEYDFKVNPVIPGNEILIAELGMVGFESFVENEEGFKAYIQKKEWNENIMEEISILNSEMFTISYEVKEIEQVNWNEEWEKNFEPIQVADLVSVRAPFHENPNLKYDIVIEPKMSFGTGHHETTNLMIQQLIDLELENKKVLDMGCGTGILAIFAEMKGAQPIDAIDIDNWCYENSLENVERNNCKHISVYEGEASLLEGKSYDVIIANINRNILLNDIKTYEKCLNEGGILLLSGFYTEDIPMMDEKASNLGMKLDRTLELNNWVSLKYKK
ncbi:50S ribosomal protein L11 methyltransferase [Aureivirga marina]|uniref:50S ribosomal protein L11 methyltransferase n=1 Tax=Aureivirga marina TaxID=1182451 RepID=UPI0018C94E98|nr:50S ribosomal protein L11 methyltransferase [Aureivirga marina]